VSGSVDQSAPSEVVSSSDRPRRAGSAFPSRRARGRGPTRSGTAPRSRTAPAPGPAARAARPGSTARSWPAAAGRAARRGTAAAGGSGRTRTGGLLGPVGRRRVGQGGRRHAGPVAEQGGVERGRRDRLARGDQQPPPSCTNRSAAAACSPVSRSSRPARAPRTRRAARRPASAWPTRGDTSPAHWSARASSTTHGSGPRFLAALNGRAPRQVVGRRRRGCASGPAGQVAVAASGGHPRRAAALSFPPSFPPCRIARGVRRA
jgi:hypothetical protein